MERIVGNNSYFDSVDYCRWEDIAHYARYNFGKFLEDVLGDFLYNGLRREFNSRATNIAVSVSVPRDYQFVNCSYSVDTDTPPDTYTSCAMHISVEGSLFRRFTIALPMPDEYIFRNPREMKTWLDRIGGYLLSHIQTQFGNIIAPHQRGAFVDQNFARPRYRGLPKTEQNKKAEELLLSHCNKKQKSDYKKNNWFIVKGQSGTRYRIRRASQINVDVLDGNTVCYKLCTVPDKHGAGLPVEDQMLAQKTLIELDEEQFLSIAIKWR